MTPALKIVSGKEVGTKSWADKTRKRAIEVSSGLETGYMELAEILYTLYDIPVDGNPTNGPWYKEWGYNSIGEFAEKELNLQPRKAEYLRNIWFRMEIELCDMDAPTKLRLVNLGWSKLREIVKVVTLKTASKWADAGEKCNYQMLCSAVKKYQEDTANAKAAKEKGESYSIPTVDAKELPYAGLPPETALAWGAKPVVASVDPEELDEIPVPAKNSSRNFSCFPDQVEIVDAALERAAQMSNSKFNSHNLTVICQDFLATNLFGKPGEEQLIRFLTKYEALFNIKLVILDKDDEPIYGISHLENLAEKLKEEP